ncbi:hypothetical protein D3C73_1465050 [compost metagenome]
MDVNDNASCLDERGGLTFFASIRASTGCSYRGLVPFTKSCVHLMRPCTKELAISTLRPIVASVAALKNLHQTGKISRA